MINAIVKLTIRTKNITYDILTCKIYLKQLENDMRKFRQNKLWRDKTPALMEETGSIIHIKNLSDIEYLTCLLDKLEEESIEVKQAIKKEDVVEELADVLEVLDAICEYYAINKDELEKCKQKKLSERGGFYKRKFVTVAEHQNNSFGEKYCLKQPEKYPEIKTEDI